MTVLPSVRVADRWCWEVRVAKPVNISHRPAVDLEAAGVAVCQGAAVEATEVSPRYLQRYDTGTDENTRQNVNGLFQCLQVATRPYQTTPNMTVMMARPSSAQRESSFSTL